MQPLRLRASGAIVAGFILCAVALGASPAFGWEISKSTNGIVINREPTDATSTAVTAYLYTGYKGGNSWSTSYSPMSASSYATETSLGTVMPTGASGDAIELDLNPSVRLQAIVLSQSGIGQRWFALINEPQRVEVVNTPTVNVTGSTTVTGTVRVSDMPDVRASVSSTLPLSTTVHGLPDDMPATLAAFACLALGWVTHRALLG